MKPSIKKFLGLWGFTLIVGILTYFLAGPLLRITRSAFGAKLYWFSGLFLCISLQVIHVTPMAIYFLSLWLSIGIYSELEILGRAGFKSALLSTILSTLVTYALCHLWIQGLDPSVKTEFFDQLKQTFTTLGWPVDSTPESQNWFTGLINLLPSLVHVMTILSLGFALMLESRWARIFNVDYNKVATHMKILDFKVPDYFIWILIVSFLFSFVGFTDLPQLKILAQNVVNSVSFFYLFQGLAVVEVGFLLLRTSSWLKLLIYFIILGQLFFILSLIGVIDYWLDFRNKFKSWIKKKEVS